MSYCTSCGAYMPDWADECPACGAPKADKNKKTTQKKKTTGQASSASAGAAQEKSGEYHYSYKKPEKKGGGASGAGERRSAAGTGGASDRGAFRYESSRRADGGTFTYGGSSRSRDRYEPKSRNDYEREYRSDAKKNRLLAALCYFGPLFVLSWALKPKSSFVRYHANQGLLLLITWIVVNIFDFIPFMGLLNIFWIVCFFIGISNAYKGKRKPLPVIGEITLIK